MNIFRRLFESTEARKERLAQQTQSRKQAEQAARALFSRLEGRPPSELAEQIANNAQEMASRKSTETEPRRRNAETFADTFQAMSPMEREADQLAAAAHLLIPDVLTQAGLDRAPREEQEALLLALAEKAVDTVAGQRNSGGAAVLWAKDKICERLFAELKSRYPEGMPPHLSVVVDFMKHKEEVLRKTREDLIERRVRQATSDGQMVDMLVNLCNAYTANDRDAISKLEPQATAIGKQLDARGGIFEMRRVFRMIPQMGGKRTLEMHWGGIGEWRG